MVTNITMPSIANIFKAVSYFIKSATLTLFIMTMFMFSHNAFALSTVTAVIDKNPVMINESILLTVTADDDVTRNALDTKPLLKNFIVGQTSVSSQTNMVNFKTSRLTTWQIVLIARKEGQFIIPALTVENQQSKPVEVTVLASKSDNSQDNQNDIFVTSEFSSDEVYVQQSLTLTIKLHFSVELQSASITEPELPGATIEKVAKDKQSDTIINGKRYRVIEQTYAITPEKSGDFTLVAPVFSGEVRQASNRRSNFMSFGQTKPVSIVGNELKLNVLPIPTNYPSNAEWLPTDILILNQEWQGDNGQFTVGEPITRTITLTATGLSKAQLPKLDMKNSRGLKIYPDQAELNSTLRDGRLISQKVQNFALVPSTPGEFVIPEMNVTWFNIITNKIEQATLPSRTITVIPPADGFVSSSPNPFSEQNRSNNLQATSSRASGANNNIENATNQQTATNTLVTVQDNRLQWLFLSLWLLTCVAWFVHIHYVKRNNTNNSTHDAGNKRVSNTGNHYLALVAACKKNDAEQTLNLVLPWLRQLLNDVKIGREIHNIAQAQSIIQEQSFVAALDELQQHLYGKNERNMESNTWNGMALSNAIQIVNKQQGDKVTTDILSLNP